MAKLTTVNGALTGRVVYVHDASGNLAAEYDFDGSGNPVTAQSPCGTPTCYVSVDQLGSTRLVTDNAGNVAKRYDFSPFGTEIFAGTDGRTAGMKYQTSADGFSPKFTGQFRGAADTEGGLDYFHMRYYSPEQGRFVSADPENAGAVPGNPQSWNAYSYVWGDPLNLLDPDGLNADPCAEPEMANDSHCLWKRGHLEWRFAGYSYYPSELEGLPAWNGLIYPVWVAATAPGGSATGGPGGNASRPIPRPTDPQAIARIVSDCAGRCCSGTAVGVGVAAVAGTVATLPTQMKPFAPTGASVGTSWLSENLRGVLSGRFEKGWWAPTLKHPLSTTKSIAGFAGRWAAVASVAGLLYDGYKYVKDFAPCMKECLDKAVH